jgi:inhibitor of cysteine peptidase
MKKNPILFFAVLLVFSCLGFPGSVVRADQDPLLKIQAFPDQDSVKSGTMFLVNVQVANLSSGSTVEFWSNSCSYEKHWVTDNAGVFIQSWTCNENTLEQVTLDPNEIYGKNILLYIPKKDKTGSVTFKLGFKRMSEDGDVAEPLWSDPVTMNVIVPEEMKEAASPATGEGISQAPDQAPAAPAETNEIPAISVSDPAAPAGSQSSAFEDPGVPIKVQPGDEFSIALASNPSTGFRWKMTLPEDQETVTFLGASHVASEEVMPGVPGKEVYKFKAVTPGATNVEFVYERPWEPKAAPTRKSFTILVQEN